MGLSAVGSPATLLRSTTPGVASSHNGSPSGFRSRFASSGSGEQLAGVTSGSTPFVPHWYHQTPLRTGSAPGVPGTTLVIPSAHRTGNERLLPAVSPPGFPPLKTGPCISPPGSISAPSSHATDNIVRTASEQARILCSGIISPSALREPQTRPSDSTSAEAAGPFALISIYVTVCLTVRSTPALKALGRVGGAPGTRTP